MVDRRRCDECKKRRRTFVRRDGRRQCSDCFTAMGVDEMFRAVVRLEANLTEHQEMCKQLHSPGGIDDFDFADREADLLKQITNLRNAWQDCGETCREIARERDAKSAVIRKRDAALAAATEEAAHLTLLIARAAKLLPLLTDSEWDDTVSSDHSDLLRAFNEILGGEPRALAATPPDRVVVAREDAEMAATALDLTAARWAHDEADPMPGAAQMADAAATRIRAALARLEASDG